MPEGKHHPFLELFMTAWIVVRVGLILVVWLSIFLALFLGYFTVPIIMVIVISGIYALTDATFFVASRMRQQAENMREEILNSRSRPEDDEPPADSA